MLSIALGVALAVIFALVIVLVTQSNGAGSTPTKTEPGSAGRFDLTGSFTLTDGVTTITGGSGGCAGRDGYDDITDGTLVTIYSSTGEVLATGHLDASLYNSSTNSCKFHIKVNVPDGQDFYQVEVSHRGKIAVPNSKAKSGDVSLTLG